MCKEIFIPNIIKSIRPEIIHPSKFVMPQNKATIQSNFRRRTKNVSAFKDAKNYTSGAVATQVLVFNVTPAPGDTMFVTMRNGNGSTLTTYTGWTLLGSVSATLYCLVRIADATDTGTYSFIWSGATNNFVGHAIMISGTIGYQDFLITTVTNSLTPTSPSLSILKNSTMIYYFSTAGNANGATASSIPAGYTVSLSSGFNIQTTYQTFSADTTSSYTVTFSPGTGPATTRIIRIQILGAT